MMSAAFDMAWGIVSLARVGFVIVTQAQSRRLFATIAVAFALVFAVILVIAALS